MQLTVLVKNYHVHKLISDEHISELCKNAGRKIHTLARVAPYINISKKDILMNAFLPTT